ncbi:MAG TPA: amino acid permease, partial [Terriglobia bacterium]|nr:amino acid permease [Terriglobia bacterium]
FVLRFKQPGLVRPFKMWFYPIPGIISLLGWLYILITSARGALLFALVVFALGSAAYFFRARAKGEWPFLKSESVGNGGGL